ncbi:MAG TPA: CPBP family intramembrane glutamic endopeptidase [Blastocatellia bacterium]|nr:CPBP family intramembrane glutamic endopeptidase [Blastocatellia bacterium]
MSSIITYCPTCGLVLDPAPDPAHGGVCPQCSPVPLVPHSVSEEQAPLWGVGTGFFVWIASVALTIGLPIVFAVAYVVVRMLQTGQPPSLPTMMEDRGFILVTVGSTLPAHLLILLICWLVVTSRGRRPFWRTLGWEWYPQFKWVHAVGLAFLMLGVAIVFQKLLPHRETDFEKILMRGYSVRVMIAVLAVMTAPLVEEIVYRGVLYGGIERAHGKSAAVVVATFLFALVHVQQYWGSVATLATIFLLSLVLTMLRAWTGKLLPCVATHLVFNGIQAAGLLLTPDKAINSQPDQAALMLIWRILGLEGMGP